MLLSDDLTYEAERQGFEPWEQLPVHRISSAARSTTPASFQTTAKIIHFILPTKYARNLFSAFRF